MILRNTILFFLFISNIIFQSCSSLNGLGKEHFYVKDAYYQSWIVSETEKGTNIYVIVNDVNNGVVFDSVIFRGMSLPVSVEINDSTTLLKSSKFVEISRLDNGSKPSDKPDQLIYSYKGKKQFYNLNAIRRENMKYY